jgi:hypothetical protein
MSFTSLEGGNRSSFQNVVFSRWTNSKNPVIVSVIHRRQNPLESASTNFD